MLGIEIMGSARIRFHEYIAAVIEEGMYTPFHPRGDSLPLRAVAEVELPNKEIMVYIADRRIE
jgi:hypothetical protein